MRRKHKNKSGELRQEREIVVEYYKKNPIEFIERELGVELYGWQKFLLKFTLKGISK